MMPLSKRPENEKNENENQIKKRGFCTEKGTKYDEEWLDFSWLWDYNKYTRRNLILINFTD